ncbi:MAG: hypothetical protein F4057_12345 [Acidobacteria bacterium]|nr:hypothetical protein [Acidobacteriota bacterium]
MKPGRSLVVPAILLAVLAALALGQRAIERAAAAQNRGGREAPRFEVDPRWPTIPDSVTMGEVTSVAVDRNDHVWILHRPETAPAVLEFDGSGRYLGGWGGPSDAYEWPAVAHGISVDYKNNVWIGGRSPDPPTDDMLLKFTAAGELLLQIGRRGASGGNADTMNLRQPADQFVHEGTNELLVADGYGNRRVIVFDADSGEYKRMWGGFGNPPVEGTAGQAESEPLDATGPGPDQFTNPPLEVTAVHCVTVANDGLVYVCDRDNRRIQVFDLDGTYRTQMFLNRAAESRRSASRVAFSPDPGQRFMYVADFNSRVVIVERETLEILGAFGSEGSGPGQFQGIHHLATDSDGNLYVAESAPGSRVQKFVLRGMERL